MKCVCFGFLGFSGWVSKLTHKLMNMFVCPYQFAQRRFLIVQVLDVFAFGGCQVFMVVVGKHLRIVAPLTQRQPSFVANVRQISLPLSGNGPLDRAVLAKHELDLPGGFQNGLQRALSREPQATISENVSHNLVDVGLGSKNYQILAVQWIWIWFQPEPQSKIRVDES